MNNIGGQTIDSRMIMIFLIICAMTMAAGLVLAKASLVVAMAVTVGLVLAIIGFANTELALYVLIVAMLLGPQITAGPAEAFVARGRGGMTLRFDDFVVVVIGLSWFLRTAVDKKLGIFPSTPLNRPIALYFLVCLLATLFGYLFDRVKSVVGILTVLKYFEYFFIYFMAVNHLKEKRQVERFTAVILTVCFVICLYAIYQIPGGERASAPFEGPQGEPNTLGGYLILMLSVAIGLLLHYGSKTEKILLGILVFFIVIALGATLSRTSWVALVPMTFALIYFTKRKTAIIVTMLIVLVIAPFILPKAVVDRAMFTFNQPREAGQLVIGGTRIDTSTSERLNSYQIILTRDFMKQPLFGYGITGYSFVDAQYPRVLAETGILGLLAFIYLLRATYRNARLIYRKTQDPFFSGLALGYLGGYVALLFHAIGANTFVIVRIMEPFWFLTAMVIMIPSIEAGQNEVHSRTA